LPQFGHSLLFGTSEYEGHVEESLEDRDECPECGTNLIDGPNNKECPNCGKFF
jgi:rubrerythrin